MLRCPIHCIATGWDVRIPHARPKARKARFSINGAFAPWSISRHDLPNTGRKLSTATTPYLIQIKRNREAITDLANQAAMRA
jgi:hypothetical protein